MLNLFHLNISIKAAGMSARHCYEFQSLGQRLTGSDETDLMLIVENFGPSTLQVVLVNKFFDRHCKNLLKKLCLAVIIGFSFLALHNLAFWQMFVLNGILLMWLLRILSEFRNLAKQGTSIKY